VADFRAMPAVFATGQRFAVAWNKFNARLDQKVNSLAAEN
jgi:hypothetical protein